MNAIKRPDAASAFQGLTWLENENGDGAEGKEFLNEKRSGVGCGAMLHSDSVAVVSSSLSFTSVALLQRYASFSAQ